MRLQEINKLKNINKLKKRLKPKYEKTKKEKFR